MDFQKTTYDGDLDEMDAEDLRTIVSEYEEAQEANIAEFESAKETIEGLEGEVAEKAEFKDQRVEKLVEVSPLGEDEAENFSLARIDDLIAEFTEESETEGDDVEDDDEPTFEDQGTRGPTHDGDGVETKYAEVVDSVPGVVVDNE